MGRLRRAKGRQKLSRPGPAQPANELTDIRAVCSQQVAPEEVKMSMFTRSVIRLCVVIATALPIAALATPAAAITNGAADGDAHPYVGIASSRDEFCSGTLLSPRVFLTAGHCTSDFAATGEPTFVTFDPNASPSSRYLTGTPHTEPGFFNIPPQKVGVPASVGHDLGVIVLDQPVNLPAYGTLPALNSLNAANGTSVTLVGYGAQGWVPQPGGRIPTSTFVRTQAQATLINDQNANGGEFVLVSTNPGRDQGGIGPGDSGSPAFLNRTTTIAAIGSHGASPSGSGTAYSSRLDTIDALAFISPFLS
jgi:V8-like Glu-specific endopeptidase